MFVCGLIVPGILRSSTSCAVRRTSRIWAIGEVAKMHESVFKERGERPSAKRVWERDRKPTGGRTFKMMSYNILADELALKHARELYPHVPRWCLEWNRRWQMILEDIKEQSPDILCLQEVDHFAQVSEALAKEGYEGHFAQRSGGRSDGCATFWRSASFSMLKMETIHYSDFDLRDNVALLVLLQPINQTEDNARCLVIGNIHVLFNPKRGEIKLAQTRILMNAMNTMMAGGAFGIMTGDFNSTPNSWVYKFITQGQIDCADCHARSVSGQHEGWMDRKTNSRSYHNNRRPSNFPNQRYRPAQSPQQPTHNHRFSVPFQFKDRYSTGGYAAQRLANKSRLEFISPETGTSVMGPNDAGLDLVDSRRDAVECVNLLSDDEMAGGVGLFGRDRRPDDFREKREKWNAGGGGSRQFGGNQMDWEGGGQSRFDVRQGNIENGEGQVDGSTDEMLLRLKGGAGSPEPDFQQKECQGRVSEGDFNCEEVYGGGRNDDDSADTFHVWKMLRKSLKTFGGIGMKATMSQPAETPVPTPTPPGIQMDGTQPTPIPPSSSELPVSRSGEAEEGELAGSSRGWWTDSSPLRLMSHPGGTAGHGTSPSPCPVSRLNPLEPGSGFDKPPPVYFGQPGVSGLTNSTFDHHQHRKRRPFCDPSSPLSGWTWEHLQIATGFSAVDMAGASKRGPGQGNWIVSHPLQLVSAHWRVCRKEPNYTTVHAQTIATVDFVYYSSKPVHGISLKPISVLNVPPVEPKSMPSKDWASDHMFLAVEFWMGADDGQGKNDRWGSGGGGAPEWGRRKESRWDKREWGPGKQRWDKPKW
ncbi:hypothetical protein BSKO_05614 [Bryopsis sp. KO-2023]|nr:hypothetical protein BSKO_05614 [Bryopsis sp. KO-2023]